MKAQSGLVSVGYEGRSLDQLVERLLAQRVDILVDIRLTALSRKPGLSKLSLAAALETAGIGYLHLPGLGNPKDNRDPFWNGPIEVGIARFRRMLRTPEASACLNQLADMAKRQRVAVLCFERDHHRCHRQVVTDEVASRAHRLPALAYA
jgi:uncharacterized protein (DUF488 family)